MLIHRDPNEKCLEAGGKAQLPVVEPNDGQDGDEKEDISAGKATQSKQEGRDCDVCWFCLD